MSENRRSGQDSPAGFIGFLPDDLLAYADDIADWKMSSVEHEMAQDPKRILNTPVPSQAGKLRKHS